MSCIVLMYCFLFNNIVDIRMGVRICLPVVVITLIGCDSRVCSPFESKSVKYGQIALFRSSEDKFFNFALNDALLVLNLHLRPN